MPRFYFNYHTPDASTRDDTGCEFQTLDLAYLDAYCSMIDLGAEILKAQCNPASHVLEIADRAGRVLMELRFSDVFSGARTSTTEFRRSFDTNQRSLRERMATCQALRASMEEACVIARENVARAHEMLRRARQSSPPSLFSR